MGDVGKSHHYVNEPLERVQIGQLAQLPLTSGLI